mgnify:CR=1 FL=1
MNIRIEDLNFTIIVHTFHSSEVTFTFTSKESLFTLFPSKPGTLAMIEGHMLHWSPGQGPKPTELGVHHRAWRSPAWLVCTCSGVSLTLPSHWLSPGSAGLSLVTCTGAQGWSHSQNVSPSSTGKYRTGQLGSSRFLFNLMVTQGQVLYKYN